MGNFTIDEMHDFLKYWVDNELSNDYTIAWETGYTEICIYLMQSSGALWSDDPIQKAILNYKVSSKTFGRLCNECFKGVVIMTNPKTNETFWIPTLQDQGLDYFISEDECRSWGYTDKHIFGDKEVA